MVSLEPHAIILHAASGQVSLAPGKPSLEPGKSSLEPGKSSLASGQVSRYTGGSKVGSKVLSRSRQICRTGLGWKKIQQFVIKKKRNEVTYTEKTGNHSTHLNFKRRAAAPRKLHVRGALDILDTLPTPPPDSYVSREGE
jgi:hypothetical protein